ncbi:hypothetical protein [Pseudoalteromonas denitrificans]|uniref:Salt-induced outer membrane protein YdiY n=1 Tax=Pseudoalteromonas denitrificans DSM 6059 TaxID=1123010 RepID=A0A1I1U4Q7_9GAMM|nr:hypothetical protein [Pseudoalteromonas denitrificans]SFD65792.1 hypothetical protein SAMN02745724_05114 [Pseudoalteromonas denitrificans DSM 6059]
MKAFIGLLCTLLVFPSVFASEKSPWKLVFELKGESDSNVVNDDIEEDSGSDSISRQFKLAMGYKQKLSKKTNVGAYYTYFSKNYLAIDGYDSDIHLVKLKTSHKFDKLKMNIDGIFANSTIDSERFLHLKQLSPSLSYFINKTNYLHGSVSLGKKDYEYLEERSVTQKSISGKYYYMLNGLNHYMTAGIKLKDENAREVLYSYDMLEFKLAYTYRMQLFDLRTRLNLNYRYQNRDYSDEEHWDIGEFRSDKRNQFRVAYRINWPLQLYSELELIRNFNQSNLDSADYNQTKIGLMLGYKL